MNKKTFIYIIIILTLIMFNIVTIQSQIYSVLLVTVENTLLKEKPQNFCNTVRVLDLNEEIGVIDEIDNWYKVATKFDEEGWIQKSLLSYYNTLTTTVSEDVAQGESSTTGARGPGTIVKAPLTIADLTGFNKEIFEEYINRNKDLSLVIVDKINNAVKDFPKDPYTSYQEFRDVGDLGEYNNNDLEKLNDIEYKDSYNLDKTLDDKYIEILNRNDWKEEEKYYFGIISTVRLLKDIQILNSTSINEYLNQIGTTLSLASKKPTGYKPYRFLVLDSEDIFSYSSPAGYIFISKGMFMKCSNEDELAAILACELSKIIIEQKINSIDYENWKSVFDLFYDLVIKSEDKNDYLTLFNNTFERILKLFEVICNDVLESYNPAFDLVFKEEYNIEAMKILYTAGYNPYSIISTNTITKSDFLNNFDDRAFVEIGGSSGVDKEYESELRKLLEIVDINDDISNSRIERFNKYLEAIS